MVEAVATPEGKQVSVESRIVQEVAERATSRAARSVVRQLRAMTEPLMSGEDSGLANVWEEVCVQVQVEHSFHWGAYVATMGQFANEAIERMHHHERCALWLETQQGADWATDVEERSVAGEQGVDQSPTYRHEDLVELITQATCDLAANWSNPRIRSHNERSMMRD